MLCSLPTEIILCILNYVSQGNHLDLVPLANTCRRLHSLFSDRTVWTGPVNVVIDQSSLYSARHLYMPLLLAAGGNGIEEAYHSSASTNLRTPCVNIAIEKLEACDHAPELIRRFHDSSTILSHLAIYTPTQSHTRIVEYGLASPSPSKIESITLRDPYDHDIGNAYGYVDDDGDSEDDDDGSPVTCWLPLEDRSKEVLVLYLSNSSRSLKTIDMPTCPLDWLLPLQLDQLESLTVSCNVSIDGPQLKQAFPQLRDLTLCLARADQFSLIRPLLSDKQLYPWVESITVICRDDLRIHLAQEEIAELLVSLDGVSRLNAGWDMVAINAL